MGIETMIPGVDAPEVEFELQRLTAVVEREIPSLGGHCGGCDGCSGCVHEQ